MNFQKELNVEDLKKSVKKNIKKIIITSVVLGLLVFIFVRATRVKKYEAKTSFIINDIYGLLNVDKEASGDSNDVRQTYIDNITAIAGSDNVISQVIKENKLIEDPNEVIRDLTVTNPGTSSIIEMSYTNKRAGVALSVVRSIRDHLIQYLEDNNQMINIDIVKEADHAEDITQNRYLLYSSLTMVGTFLLGLFLILVKELNNKALTNQFDIIKYTALPYEVVKLGKEEIDKNDVDKILGLLTRKTPLLISSLNEDPNKSDLALAIYEAISQRGSRVLLLNLDPAFDKGEALEIGGLTSLKGSSSSKLVKFTLTENESFDLINSKRLKDELEVLKEDFDYILLVGDYLFDKGSEYKLLENVDELLLLVEFGKSKIEDFYLTLNKLESKNIKVAGIVANEEDEG